MELATCRKQWHLRKEVSIVDEHPIVLLLRGKLPLSPDRADLLPPCICERAGGAGDAGGDAGLYGCRPL